jgi:chromosome segregation ATPase
MHLQKMSKKKICDLEAQLEAKIQAASARYAEAEQREEAERQLSVQQGENGQMQQEVTSLRASYDALKEELQAAERKACAAAEQAAAVESQLSDTQVSGSSGSD